MFHYAGDADLVIGANNKIQEGLGQKALFGNKQEYWEFITSRKEVGISSPALEEQKFKGEIMDKKRDGYAIVANVIKSLEKGGFFSPSDREKFAQTAREHGIEGSVIEEVIDIGQTLSLIYRHEDRLDESDLAREEKKAVRAELQIGRAVYVYVFLFIPISVELIHYGMLSS
ncbi:hypothetical protein HpHA223_14460 [Helicobacter pylori]